MHSRSSYFMLLIEIEKASYRSWKYYLSDSGYLILSKDSTIKQKVFYHKGAQTMSIIRVRIIVGSIHLRFDYSKF